MAHPHGFRGWLASTLCLVLGYGTLSCGDWEDSPLPPGGDDDSASPDDDTSPTADDDTTPTADDDTTPTADDDTTPIADDDTTPPLGPDCSPGPGLGKGDDCYDGETQFRDEVQASVVEVMAAHPDWFDWSTGTAIVLDSETYRLGVVALVAAYDLCVIPDPNAGDEIAVKYNNEFAESFDILTWDNYPRWGDGIYTATCAPSWF